MIKFIEYFQKNPTPMNCLACGHLLRGLIENRAAKNLATNEEYMKHRDLLAIDFYRKAACDHELKPMVEHILWEMKTFHDEESAVYKKIAPFILKPMIEVHEKFQQDERRNCPELADNTGTLVDISKIKEMHSNSIKNNKELKFFGNSGKNKTNTSANQIKMNQKK